MTNRRTSTCPELGGNRTRKYSVDLGRYTALHSEGRHLISTWFQRAWQKRDCHKDEAFEPFIFTWFAFNGWAACVTEQDTDRDMINALALDERINSTFTSLIESDTKFKQISNRFFEFLPIFDVRSLQKKRILRYNSGDRRKLVNFYLEKGVTKFEPKCWKCHHDNNETAPMDWSHFITAVYQVRCNLFHGWKAAHSEMDQVIVHSAYLSLAMFLFKAGYIDPL
ncbi:hypothetical protein [Chloroflexus islandicus]|uniref:hypothetical protein n=1 Tax=Chloroflexus islandicus TaxID=1707952 RepID=UPI000A7846B2|nr:hypothetical protein [Chloroflexus islandicus]